MNEKLTVKLRNGAKLVGEKVQDGFKWTVRKVSDTIQYVKENPRDAAAAVGVFTTVVGGTTKVVKSVNRHRALRQEQYHRDREVYDRSLNMYVTTKRKLTKADLDRINEIKRKTGKRTTEVLSDLNLLKK